MDRTLKAVWLGKQGDPETSYRAPSAQNRLEPTKQERERLKAVTIAREQRREEDASILREYGDDYDDQVEWGPIYLYLKCIYMLDMIYVFFVHIIEL